MLHDFMTRERSSILSVAKQKANETQGSRKRSDAVEEGWGIFYDELIGLLSRDQPFEFHAEKGLHTAEAQKQGKEYLRLGYTVSEVVHSYGVLCQAVTALAGKLNIEITPREFQQLNLSLDTVIAEAVTEFEKDRRTNFDTAEVKRLGFLAHELRNYLQSAMIALETIQSGSVGVQSLTGGVLQGSLEKMTELIDTALTEVRLRSEPEAYIRRARVFEIMSEVGVTVSPVARAKNIVLQMQGDSRIEVNVDWQLLVSALSNLVQNALKFTKHGGTVQVRTREEGDRVLIEVEDECGGISEPTFATLFESGAQRGNDRTGMGLGLAISKQAIERNNGVLRVENLSGKGCIFIIDLPQQVDT